MASTFPKSPLQLLLMGLIRGSPTPLTPPLGGQQYFFLLTVKESNIFWNLLTSNITWAILGESSDPPDPLPLYTNRGLLVGPD